MNRSVLAAYFLVVLLALPASEISRCEAVVVYDSEQRNGLSQTSEKFMLWETCDDVLNEEKNRTERCCSGNYKCSSEKCKDNTMCKFISLWCHKETCKPKKEENESDKEKDNGKDKDKDKDKDVGKDKDKAKDEGDGPEASEEASEDEDDEKNDKDKKDDEKEDKDNVKGEKEKDKEDKDDADKSPSPSPSASLQVSASPSATASITPSPSAVTAAPPVFDPLNCDGQRNRIEIRDLSAEERQRWQQAIVRMRADRDENGDSEWDRLVRLHLENSDEAHGGSYFLPWHRLFLLQLENSMRKYDAGLALPYWDWSLDAADAATSAVWQGDYVGGALRGKQPITSGAFQNMDGRYPSQHIVRRDFTSGRSGEIPLLWSMPSLEEVINRESFEDFSDGIESAHALVHIYIGGDMADTWLAPNDPLFGVHHAFVDRLYKMRQNRRGKWEFGGTHDFVSGTQAVSPDRIMAGFGVPVSRAFDLPCVKYVAPRLQGRTAAGRGGRNAEDECGNQAFNSGHAMSRERCERGTAILQGST